MAHPLTNLLASYMKDPRHWVKNISWRMPRTISRRKFVFIVGAPRSGTTLLHRILTVHSRLFSIEGESGLFTAQNIFNRRHFYLSREESSLLLADSRDIVDFFERSTAHLAKGNNGIIFVEKTPQHVFRLPFILKHFPNSSLVHIMRDGRDCYCSSLGHPNIPQNRSIEHFARYWNKCVLSGLAAGDNAAVISLRYEDLVTNPAVLTDKVMKFIGLDFEETQLDPVMVSADQRADLDVFRKLREPVNARSVGRWKQELNEAEVRRFERIARKGLGTGGYL